MVPANRTKMADVWVPFLEEREKERERRKRKERESKKKGKTTQYKILLTLWFST